MLLDASLSVGILGFALHEDALLGLIADPSAIGASGREVGEPLCFENYLERDRGFSAIVISI